MLKYLLLPQKSQYHHDIHHRWRWQRGTMKSEIRKASCSQDLWRYLIHQFLWCSNTPALVWWEIHGSTMRSIHFNDRRHIRKFICRFLTGCRPVLACNCLDLNSVIYVLHVVPASRLMRIYSNAPAYQAEPIWKWLEKVKTFLYNKDFTPDHTIYLISRHGIFWQIASCRITENAPADDVLLDQQECGTMVSMFLIIKLQYYLCTVWFLYVSSLKIPICESKAYSFVLLNTCRSIIQRSIYQ